eukprot:14370178-Alexandrium_andersonii.AAC.1
MLMARALRHHPAEAAAMLIPEIELRIGEIQNVLWTAPQSGREASFLVEAHRFFAPIREQMVDDLLGTLEFQSVPPIWEQRVNTFIWLFKRLEEAISLRHSTGKDAEPDFPT